jgi:hypothetical protein
MAQRVGGVLKISYDGNQIPAKGSFVISPSSVEREGVAGQDYVHGFVEKPRVPFIKGQITTRAEVSLEDLLAITDATVTADLANGKSYVLTEAWTKGAFEIDTDEGHFDVEFQGLTCEEI